MPPETILGQLQAIDLDLQDMEAEGRTLEERIRDGKWLCPRMYALVTQIPYENYFCYDFDPSISLYTDKEFLY